MPICLQKTDIDSRIGNLVWAFTDLTAKSESHLGINDASKDNSNTLAHYKCSPKSKACFIRRISVASNAIQTIDNEMSQLINYCLNCIRRD